MLNVQGNLFLVCNFIKGKKADVALRDLKFSRKRISRDKQDCEVCNFMQKIPTNMILIIICQFLRG